MKKNAFSVGEAWPHRIELVCPVLKIIIEILFICIVNKSKMKQELREKNIPIQFYINTKGKIPFIRCKHHLKVTILQLKYVISI